MGLAPNVSKKFQVTRPRPLIWGFRRQLDLRLARSSYTCSNEVFWYEKAKNPQGSDVFAGHPFFFRCGETPSNRSDCG